MTGCTECAIDAGLVVAPECVQAQPDEGQPGAQRIQPTLNSTEQRTRLWVQKGILMAGGI